MSAMGKGARSGTSDFEILSYLAGVDADRERSKYWIEKRTGLARQTTYDAIKRLRQARLISQRVARKSRAGKLVRYYYLKEAGWMKMARLPDLSEDIQRKLEGKWLRYFSGLRERAERENRRQIRKIVRVFRSTLKTDRREGAAPNSVLLLTITVDGKGHVEFGARSSSPKLVDRMLKWVRAEEGSATRHITMRAAQSLT